ncbi:MAG: tryptophan synthase subunit alpha [Bryobacterales bacterium]
MNRIAQTFERLKASDEKGLIAYLTAGDPSPDRTVELILALEAGGADILELGVPFSDPMADGPVIQKASERALRAGTTLPKVLAIIRETRKSSELPIIVFSYLNPILRYGFERFAEDAQAAGADGALLTDLSIDAAEPYLEQMRKHELATVFLGAQTSTDERLKQLADASTGFLYLVSTAGVTGMRDAVSNSAVPLLERARKQTAIPLAVGFGLSKREHMEAVAPHCDAAIVGSAFMRVVEQNQQAPDLAAKLQALAGELKAGLRAPAGAPAGA